MTASGTLVTPEMVAAVGTTLDRTVSFPVSASDIRRWALAVYFPDEPPPQFWDETSQAALTAGGIVAPEEFNPFAWMCAEPGGMKPSYEPGGSTLEARLGLAEVPTKSMLNGGTTEDYGAAIRPGDVIVATSALAAYDERPGRLGQMLFTRTSSHWTNQRGEPVKTVVNTLIRY